MLMRSIIIAYWITGKAVDAQTVIETIFPPDTYRQRFVIMPSIRRNRADAEHRPHKCESLSPIRKVDLNKHRLAFLYRTGHSHHDATCKPVAQWRQRMKPHSATVYAELNRWRPLRMAQKRKMPIAGEGQIIKHTALRDMARYRHFQFLAVVHRELQTARARCPCKVELEHTAASGFNLR